MTIKNFITHFFGRSPRQKIRKLLGHIEQALTDLQIRVADSIARSSGLQKKLDQENATLSNTTPEKETERANIELRIEAVCTSLKFERDAEERMRQIYEDLKNKRQLLEHSYQQSLTRLRNAEVSNMMSDIYKDFGNNMQLNSYLEKFSEESFKVEFTADCRLNIEMLLDKAKKS